MKTVSGIQNFILELDMNICFFDDLIKLRTHNFEPKMIKRKPIEELNAGIKLCK
jgi:hypothetical protein